MKIIRKKNLRSAVLYNVKNTLHNCTFAYELHDASPSLIFSATNIRRLTVKVKSIPGTATTLAILARVASSRLTKFLPCLPALFLSGLFTEPRHTATAATHKPERNGMERNHSGTIVCATNYKSTSPSDSATYLGLAGSGCM